MLLVISRIFFATRFEAQSTAIHTSYTRQHRSAAVDTVHAVTVSFGSYKTCPWYVFTKYYTPWEREQEHIKQIYGENT